MNIKKWNEQELEEAVAGKRPLLVDLQADWCMQCGPQEKVLERVAPTFDGQIIFASVDVGQFPAVSAQYDVVGLPAMLLFKHGQHQETLRGFKRAPVIRQALKKLLDENENKPIGE